MERIGFLLVRDFQMHAYFLGVEALRIANRAAGGDVYDWLTVSVDGDPVAASNGMLVTPNMAIADAPMLSTVLVCAGFGAADGVDGRITAWLRRLARHGTFLSAFDTGAVILARAGLLAGRRAAMHWQQAGVMAERFPQVEWVSDLFVIDGDRMTCPGGIAAFDAMLALITRQAGAGLAARVAEIMIHERIRHPGEHQRPSGVFDGVTTDPRLARAIVAMEENIETPLDLTALAAVAGVTPRHLVRLFGRHLAVTPARMYRRLRLERAWRLLTLTVMDATEIGFACGFSSLPAFSRAFKAEYGVPPRDARAAAPATGTPVGGAALGRIRIDQPRPA